VILSTSPSYHWRQESHKANTTTDRTTKHPHPLPHPHPCKKQKNKKHSPKKNFNTSKGAALKQHIDATLGSGNLREAVLLPPGEDLNEWLAVNTVDFYNAISMLYGTLAEYCIEANCPTMVRVVRFPNPPHAVYCPWSSALVSFNGSTCYY
jgi:hypothetical protein